MYVSCKMSLASAEGHADTSFSEIILEFALFDTDTKKIV